MLRTPGQHEYILSSIKSIISVEFCDFNKLLDCGNDIQKKREVRALIKIVETYRIVYKVGQLRVVGYISLPKTGTNLPCIIHLRGGARDFGMLTAWGVYNHLARFAEKGYVVISTQYPGVEGGDGMDSFGGEDDITSIIKLRNILKNIPITNTRMLGVKGHSRGGLMACMLLRKVSWIKVAIIACAPTNAHNMNTNREGWKKYTKEFFGDNAQELTRRSPMYWVDELPKKVPILLIHGSADWRVPAEQSIAFSGALLKNKIPHRFILFDGADHNITEYRNEYYAHIHAWCERFLKKNEPLPNLKPHGI